MSDYLNQRANDLATRLEKLEWADEETGPVLAGIKQRLDGLEESRSIAKDRYAAYEARLVELERNAGVNIAHDTDINQGEVT